MTYQVELTAGAEEDLERLSLTMARRIARMLDRLEENPCGAPAEALRGDLQGLYRMRIGDYRLVYSADRQSRIVTIEAIAPRSLIYDIVLRRLK